MFIGTGYHNASQTRGWDPFKGRQMSKKSQRIWSDEFFCLQFIKDIKKSDFNMVI
jgi:hypothetical protein